MMDFDMAVEAPVIRVLFLFFGHGGAVMWFHLDVNELSRNPRVYKVDERKIVLKTDFRIELYKLWRSGDPEGVQRLLKYLGHRYHLLFYLSVSSKG